MVKTYHIIYHFVFTVNFGLETKKSIIHPRSDSSNRSTRFSLSSEKSYPNGLCMTPGQSGCVSTCPYTKEVILNDDIEKRVLVNKDGSLSVEMKVRFRLVNDETLQWSTEIKKSATTLNESSSVKVGDAHYLQGKAEYSDPESNSACEAEEACAPKIHQKRLEESHCQSCCNHCQEYDIWKNPMHKDNGESRTRESSSSSSSSRKIMCKKASVDSIRTISRSSEEYTEHVVEKASCFQQTVEEGDTRVEYCSISRCCSHSEISGTATKLKTKRPNDNTCETNTVNIYQHNGDKMSNALFENTLSDQGSFDVLKVIEDRPISAVSNSSKVLESLKEDQDDAYDDLPPSVSRASEWSQSGNLEQENQFTCVHCYGSQASQNFHLSPRPPSKVSSCSAHSSKHKKYRSMHQTSDSARSSKVSSRSPSCHCGAITPGSMTFDIQSGLDETILTMNSENPNLRTNIPRTAVSDMDEVCEEGAVNGKRSSAMSANTSVSGKSRNSTACPYCGGCERSVSAASRVSGYTEDTQAQDAAKVMSVGGRSSKTHRSETSAKSGRSNKCTKGADPILDILENNEPVQSNPAEAEDIEGRSESALSVLSNPSATSKQSNKSNRTACGRSSAAESLMSEFAGVENEKRTKSAMSVKSNASAKSNTNSFIQDEASKTSVLDNQKAEEISQDVRAVSPMSSISNKSSKSKSSHKSNCSNSYRTVIQVIQEPRVDSVMSMKSNSSSKCPSSVLGKTGVSDESQDETVEKDASPVPAPETKADQDPEFTSEERAASVMSSTSKSSKKSNTSSRNMHLLQENAKCTKLNEAENVAAHASDVEPEERVHSARSDKTHSHRSQKPANIPDRVTTPQPDDTNSVTEAFQESEDRQRPTSAASKSSKVSAKSEGACSERASKSVLKPTEQVTVNTINSAQNSLTVSSPLPKKNRRVPTPSTPKSPITTGSNDRAPSAISVNSRGSSKSRSKCHCSSNSDLNDSRIHLDNDRNEQRVTSSFSEKSKSAKSPSPAPYVQADEPLSPTSTASVSVGLGEEEKSDVLSESSVSHLLEQGSGPLERSTPEPAADNLEIVKSKGRAITPTSMCSTVSKNSKRSSVSCKKSERATSPASIGKPDSVKSTKSMAESLASRPSDNDSALKRSTDAPQAVVENSNRDESQIDKVSTASGRSSKLSQNRTSRTAPPTGTAKSKKLSAPNLKINRTKITSDCESDTSSVKSFKTSKSENRINEKEEQAQSPVSDVPQNCADPAHEMPNKTVMPIIHLDSSNDSVLSHSLSAADLLREKVGNTRPVRRRSESNTSSKNCDPEEIMNSGSKCEKRSTSKPRKLSTSSQKRNEDQALKLMPSSLPYASPAEVINDWLKNIPTDGPMYEMEDDFNERYGEVAPQVITENEKEEESLQKETTEISEHVVKKKEPQERAASTDPVQEDNSVLCNETQACKEPSETDAAYTEPSPPPKLTKRDIFPKRCHSSVQVMKVLLSPKLDRCNSLPEVSPVYGRKLSTSAKGLLDCLADLQLIDSDPKNSKGDNYNEIVSILQSLWINEPFEKHKLTDHHSAEDEFNPRSSSGVDVSSGSIGSGKGSISGGVEKSETAQERKSSVIEQENVQVQEDTIQEGEEGDPASVTPESADSSLVPSDPLTPDIAVRVRGSPEGERLEEEKQTDEDLHAREEVTHSNGSQKEMNEAELSNKSSGNESNGVKSSTDPSEDTNSGTSPAFQKSVLTRKVSQDPDPVWVLSLLRKLENQFMSHYANAMAEFKVKWDLDDNEMLNSMISELKEEVHKRIQSSINRELQKIQSRAGRAPRPPISLLSRDSTIQTEQRRRRLKVMRNKSINTLSKDEDTNTASGTEFSDQRSEDEYCPCDTCLKKKMASKALQRAEALSLAPVLQDFDLRKILQTKKHPPAAMATEPKLEESHYPTEVTNSSNVQSNLDVVHEESEVHNDVKSQRDEVQVETEGQKMKTQSKDENTEEDTTARLDNDGCEDVANGLNKAEEENLEGQATVDGEAEKDEEREREGDTEAERLKEDDEKDTDDKEENIENNEASVAIDDGEAEVAEDKDAAKEENLPEEEAADIEEAGNGEHHLEGEIIEEVDTGEEAREEGAEEEEADEVEEKIETSEEGEVTEGGKGEETEEVLDVTKSGEKSDAPENEVEAEPCENEMTETTEGEGKDEDDTNEGGGMPPSEDLTDENQDASSQTHCEAKDEAGEDLGVEEVVEQAEGTDEKQQDEMETKNTNEAEEPDHNSEKKDNTEKDSSAEALAEQLTEADASGQACDEHLNRRLIKQITKTSVESQPGSMESATDQKIQAKLKDIHSFMESSESQDDSIVVITKQSPFTERKSLSSRHGNKEDVGNELIEWQVSPKRRNRSPARANKQRRPKDSDVKVDDLEF